MVPSGNEIDSEMREAPLLHQEVPSNIVIGIEEEYKAQIKKRDELIDNLKDLFAKAEQACAAKVLESEKTAKDMISKN